MTVTREQAQAQLQHKANLFKEVQTSIINRDIYESLSYFFGDECNGHWTDISFNDYEYGSSHHYIAYFKYDDMKFKLKVTPSNYSRNRDIYVRTKHRWKKVNSTEQLLQLMKRNKV